MVESFIILLREGIEVALVVGILIVYLRKLNRPNLLSSIYLGFGLACLASVVGAVLFQKFALDHEKLEGYLLLAAVLFVTTMIVWMWRTAKSIRGEIEGRVQTIITKDSTWQVRLGILLFTFLLVFREGIETAVFLGAVSFSQSALQSFIGVTLGVSTAIAFGVLFVKGSVRIDVARFLKVTAIVLLIFGTQLIVNALHEFYELGVLPPQPAAMGILGPIVRNNLLFILAILSIPAFMFIIPSTHRAEKDTEKSPSKMRWQLVAGLTTLSIVFFLGFDDVFSSRTETTIEPAQSVRLNDGYVHIRLSDVDDGALHRYTLKQDTVDIRFIVLRTGLNSFTTAFDACRPCYNYGKFYVSGSDIICSQCDAASPISKLSRANHWNGQEQDSSVIGSSSDDAGCFPISLRSRIDDGQILISAEDLQNKREYFEVKKEGE